MSGALRIAVVLLVAAAATIVANVALLGVAGGSHDPVGQLSPQTSVSSPSRPTTTVKRPVPPQRAHEHDHEDD